MRRPGLLITFDVEFFKAELAPELSILVVARTSQTFQLAYKVASIRWY